MKNYSLFTSFFVAVLLLAIAPLTVQAKTTYDKAYNQRMIEQITRDVLNEINRQRAEFIKAHEEAGNADKNNNNPSMPPNGGAPQDNAPKQAPPRKFKADIPRIKLMLEKKYSRARAEDMSVDTRDAIELQEEVRKEMLRDPKFNRSVESMEAEERRMAEEKYPLYQPGQKVKISFSRGHEKSRTYEGVFKTNGRFKFMIGRNVLNYNDLPEEIRACFIPQLNKEKRTEEFNKHRIITRYNLEREEEEATRMREKLNAQFAKNLPKQWVYINKAWRLPVDMVEDIVRYREVMHSQIHGQGQQYIINPTGIYNGPSN